MYGKELVLDLHECDSSLFTREALTLFIKRLCDLIDMEREDIHFWDYQGCTEDELVDIPPHLKGTSVVQFIRTSNIVIHSLDDLQKVFLNIFSCKEFDEDVASEFAAKWMKGKVLNRTVVLRS